MATVPSIDALNSGIRLNHLAALDIQGPDAEKFLQGQTSAQVSLADGRFAPLTCFCTPKGRMLANAQLMKVGDAHYRLLLSASLLETLTGHLKKFAAFYKAELTPLPELSLVGVGENARSIAEKLELPLPNAPGTQSANPRASVLCYPGDTPRWLFCLEDDSLVEALDDESGRAAWQLADIRSGLAWLTEAQQDHFLPQMLNWEALGGISFKKGCYTGQEVVARAHFRGQVKKRLVRAELSNADAPTTGDTIVNEANKAVGEVVISALSETGSIELLAVMNTKVMEEAMPVYIGEARLTLLDLPYPIERLDPEQLAMGLAN
ncbi:folate-binding protein YgfZ [Halomonas sp. SH5A2]|uniref:CAF17-like 4Fe-4S cluster assembly/insertion protein YgfZ n=1 Tax=Halomonas sp. SH5A2 TaxID=2749040 RepID=UPI00163E79AD|nr:folate-binding protein YgfZ [Halomonas sp. SH5A2]QNI02982.1 folate-binding protein YgfZ [Halomonas sp. SH5A2]